VRFRAVVDSHRLRLCEAAVGAIRPLVGTVAATARVAIKAVVGAVGVAMLAGATVTIARLTLITEAATSTATLVIIAMMSAAVKVV